MIPASRTAAAASLLAALGLHLGGVMWPAQGIQVEIEGGAQAVEAKLGTGFADLAAGVKTPVDGEDITAPVTPAETPTNTPVTAPPVAAPLASPTTPAAQLKPLTAQPAVATLVVAPTPDTLQPTTQSMTSSRRPAKRPEKVAKAVSKPKPPKKGNSKKNATAGTVTGSTKGKSASAGSVSSGKASSQGNAAASNYAGKVMRKISRARRQSVNINAASLVSFTIAANGALSGVRIARSSGSARLDKIALAQIKRAAPFPAPPQGARRTFTIEVKGR
ncbi:energy transducer TonB [Actibacterium lipolyticum]|uniref:Gram-negative bacterial tonB protein n=1 Tax=Actibacterium lipolyticum TaxID=1524263 RepID=A0A238KII4_9RHOB|nr:TonB family protein [Actibacterium lipolyticum]SMX42487.1 Gram-negative bacterial tonB protein [Actibacterium lipolyticum]